MCIDVQRLVDEVESALLAVVAQDVLLLVCVAQFYNSVANQVVDIAAIVDEHKAV